MSCTQPPSEGNSRNPRKGPKKQGPLLDWLGILIGVAGLAAYYLPQNGPWFLHLGISLGIGCLVLIFLRCLVVIFLILDLKRHGVCLLYSLLFGLQAITKFLSWLVRKTLLDCLSWLMRSLQEAMDKLTNYRR